jgi:hypothetical protein
MSFNGNDTGGAMIKVGLNTVFVVNTLMLLVACLIAVETVYMFRISDDHQAPLANWIWPLFIGPMISFIANNKIFSIILLVFYIIVATSLTYDCFYYIYSGFHFYDKKGYAITIRQTILILSSIIVSIIYIIYKIIHFLVRGAHNT